MMLGAHSATPSRLPVKLVPPFSRIELFNSDRFVSLFMLLYVILCYYYSLMSTICIKLDPGIHIGRY
jgi:hypothetical protein